MTTNVPRGTGRPSAAARTRKHAQLTPLPPRPGQVEEAREPVCLCGGDPALDGKVLIHSHKCPLKGASSNGEAPDDRSLGKARTFAEKAVPLGWTAVVVPADGAVEVTATRGAETVVQAWSGGVWSYEASIYAYGDRTTKPRNASGALKLLARSEADAAAEASKVQSNRHFRKAEAKDIEQTLEKAQKALPFDPELATDEEITGVMAGQAIVWYNRIGRSNESAIVGRKGVRITQLPDGARVANFCCPVTGYRSCLVTAILKVGRGRSLVTSGSPTEGSALVEVS